MENIFDDETQNTELVLENIRITMAAEKYFLSLDEVETLRKCYNNEIRPDEVLENIKEDINSRKGK